jgi:hypothetical protein
MQRYCTVTLSRVDSFVGGGRSGRHRESMKDNLDIGAHGPARRHHARYHLRPAARRRWQSRELAFKMLLETESGVGVRAVVCGDEGDLLDAFIAAETR